MKKKIISWVVAAVFLCSQTGLAQVVTNIQADTSKTATTVTQSGNTYNINTGTVHNRTGFNAFTNFNLGAGDTANLNLPDNTDNLVNMVTGNNKSFIDGMLNAFRSGKIGGNVFFLNPNGIAIGASGIVNVGALTLATPDKSYINSILEDNSKFAADAFSKAVLDGDVPINRSGSISVKGKINAYYGAAIHAGNVEISGANAQINTLKAADIVNLDDAPPIEIQNIGGRILIAAKKIDINDGAVIKSERETAEGKAGDIEILAYDNTAKLITDTKAEINIADAVIEGNNVKIESSAKNDYSYEDVKAAWDTLYEDIKNRIKNDINSENFGGIILELINSGFNFDGIDLSSVIDLDGIEDTLTEALNANTFIALLNEYVTDKISGAYAKSDVSAKITIGGGSNIKADETLNIKTDVYSKTNIDAEADTIAAAVGINNSVSEIIIKSGAVIESAGEANIEALSTIVSDMSAKTSGGYELSENNSGSLAAVMSVINNKTQIEIENGSTINADGDISINAVTDKTLNVKVSGSETEDNKLGAGFVYSDSVINNGINVDGNITSNGSVNINSDIKQSKNNFILGSGDSQNTAGALQMAFVTDNNSDFASVNIGENTLITAGSDINIFSKALSSTDIKAIANTMKLGDYTISAAGAFTDTKNSSLINIGKNSVVDAGQNVTLKSETGQALDYSIDAVKKKEQAENNTNFGVSAVYGITETRNAVNIYGDITAQDGGINASSSMDISKNINKNPMTYNNDEESALNINTVYSNNTSGESNGVFIGDKNNASNSLTAGKGIDISADLNSSEYISAKSSLLSAAFKNADTSVKVNIENAALNANGTENNVNITASTKETDNIIAHSALKRDKDSKNMGVSAAILLLGNKTSVNIAEDASINSGKDVNVTASTVKDLVSSAEIGLGARPSESGQSEELSLGLMYAYNDIKTDNGVSVEGQINAGGKVSVNSSITAEKNVVQTLENGGNWDKRAALEAANSALSEADKKVKENEKLYKVTQDVSEAFDKNGDGSDISALIYDAAQAAAENPQEALIIAQALADKLSEENQSGTFPDIAAAWQSVCDKVESDFNTSKTDAAAKKEAQQKARQDYEKSSDGKLSAGIALAQTASYDNSHVTVSGDITGKSVNLISGVNKKSETAYSKSDGLAVSLNDNYTFSSVNVNAPVTAAGTDAADGINISANTSITAKTETKTGSMSVASFESAAGAAVSNINTDNSININAQLESENNVTVKADTNKNITINAESLPGNNANLGLGLVYNDSLSNNGINISGDITARSGDINILSNLTDKSEIKSTAKSGNIVRNGDKANKKFGVAGAVAYSVNENNSGINIDGAVLTSGKDTNIVSLLTADSKITADGAGVAVAVVENIINAVTNVRDTVINSGNDVNIKSTLNIKYAVESVSGMMTILSFDGGAAAAVSSFISGNIISVRDCVINAAKKLTIFALTDAELSVSANALTGKASNAGVAVSDSKSDIYNEVSIKDSEINTQSADTTSVIDSKENANNVSSGTGNEDKKNPAEDDGESENTAIINLGSFEFPSFDFSGIFDIDFNLDFSLGKLQMPSLDFSKIFFDFGVGSAGFPDIDIGGILSKISIGSISLPGMPSFDLSGLFGGINLGKLDFSGLNLPNLNLPNMDIGKIFGNIGLGKFDLSGLGMPNINLGHFNMPDFGFLNFNFGDLFKGFDMSWPSFGGMNWDWFKMGNVDWGMFNPGKWDWASLNPKNLDFDWALDFGIDWLRGGGSKTPENKIAMGGALALGDHAKSALVNIDNVTFSSKDDINISAIVVDADIKSSVEAGIKNEAGFEAAGAVIYANYNDYAKAIVNNSRLDAGGAISVNSVHLIPMTGEEWLNDFNGKSITELAQTAYDKLKGGPLDALRDNLVNFWVRSSAATTGTSQSSNSGSGNGGEGGSGGESGFSAGGGVNILYFDFASEASITNSEINQNTNPLYRTGNQNVEVKAESDTTLVNVGGILGDLGSSAALGGIYNQITYDDSTKAYISDSDIYANKADIISNYKQHDITIGAAGASAGDFALEGVLNMLDSTANVDAYIDGGKVEISGGALKADASNDSLFINVAGAVDISNKISVGLTGAVNEILRNTNAYIKNIHDLRAGSIDISAVNSGIIHSYSVAGSVSVKESNGPGIVQGLKNKAADWLESLKKSNKTGKKDEPANPDNKGSYQSAGNDEDTGAFGLGISGSASVNDVEGYAQAYMENVTVKNSGDININAEESSKITSASGGVALNLQSGEGSSGVTIAGTASINLIDANAVSRISGSVIENAGNIALNSLSTSLIQAVAASLAGSTANSGANIAGSVTVNKINAGKGISSFVENSVIEASELSLNAEEKSEIKSLAGALSLTMASVSVGAGVGVNEIENKVLTYLFNSDADISGKISLVSQNIAKIETLAAAAGIAKGAVGIAASVIINNIGNKTESYIKGNKTVNGSITAGDIIATAEDKTEIDGLAGEISAAGKVGVGAAVGVNEINNAIKAYIETAVINSAKNVDLRALSSGIIKFIVASLGGGNTVGVVGGVGVNDINNTAKAGIYDSDVYADGSAAVFAQNSDFIQLISGAIALGGKVGIGGNVGLNYISNKSIAEILNSDVTALGKHSLSGMNGLLVKANIDDKADVYNAAAAGAGTVAVAGGVTGAVIENESLARIKDSEINKNNTDAGENQNVSVLADNKIEVNSYGGALALAGTVGVGIAADLLTLNNKVEAGIINSLVKAEKDIDVKTNSKEKYDLVLLAGAGSAGVSVAGSVAVVQSDIKNNAHITDSDINSDGNTTVEAKDEVILGEGDLGLAIGAAAGALYAGVAGAVFVGNITNKTNALIENSKVNAGKSINILSDSAQKIKATIPSLGGGIVGVGLTASVMSINTKTNALADGANTNLQAGEDINIEAENKLTLEEMLIAAGGGFVGVGASVAVGNINNDVSAGIGNNVKASAGKDVNVNAQNSRDIKSTAVSAAGGFVGANGSVSVLTVGGNINSNNDAKENVEGYNADLNSAISRSGDYNEENAGSGGLTSGYIANMNKLDITAEKLYGATEINNGTNAFIGKGAQITAGNDINVKADDTLKFDSTVGGTSGGFVGVGASVNIADIRTLANAYVDDNAILKAKNNINVISNNNAEKVDMLTFIATGGFVAANAAVSILDIDANSFASLGNDVNILRARNVNVVADSKLYIDNQIDRYIVGVFTTGVSVATVNKKGVTKASIGDNVKVLSAIFAEYAVADIVSKTAITPEMEQGVDYDLFDFSKLSQQEKDELLADLQESGIEVSSIEELQNDFVVIYNLEILEGEAIGIDNLTVKATNDGDINVNSISGVASGISVHADIFEIYDTNSVIASVGNNFDVWAKDRIDIFTDAKNNIAGNFISASLAVAEFGAVIAKAKTDFDNHVYIGENNNINNYNIAATSILASSNQQTDIDIKTNMLSIGGSSVLGSWAETYIGGNIDTIIGSGNNLMGNDIKILSNVNASQKAVSTMVQGAVIAVGVGNAKSESKINMKTIINDKVNIFAVSALNIENNLNSGLFAETQSGTLSAVNVADNSAVTKNDSTNEITIGSDEEGQAGVALFAQNFNLAAKTDINQNTRNRAVGASLANVTNLNSRNHSFSDVNVNIGKANIMSNNLNISAFNKYVKNKENMTTSESRGLRALGLFNSNEETAINNDVIINIGSNAVIETFLDRNLNSVFIIDAVNDIYAQNQMLYKSGEIFGSENVDTKITNNSVSEINIAGKLTSGSDMFLNARSNVDLRANANANILSVVSGFTGKSRSEADIQNLINVRSGGDIFAKGNMYLNLSQGRLSSSYYGISANTEIAIDAFIPISDFDSSAKMNLTDKLTVDEGAYIKSAESIFAGNDYMTLYVQGRLSEMNTIAYVIPEHNIKYKNDSTINSAIEINGEMHAGYNNKILVDINGTYMYGDKGYEEDLRDMEEAITIENKGSREAIGYTFTPAREFTLDLYERLDEINRALSDYGDAVPALKEAYEAEKRKILFEMEVLGLASSASNAVMRYEVPYITFDSINIGIGDVNINTNNLYGTGKITAADAPEIQINNHSNLFMEFNDIVIANRGDVSGSIKFNGITIPSNAARLSDKNQIIKQLNKDASLNVNFNEIEVGSGDTTSKIIIMSDPINLNSDARELSPSVIFNGNIDNRGGLISIDAIEGNIFLNGRISADTLNIRADNGSIFQDYTNVDGEKFVYNMTEPERFWNSISDYFADKYKTGRLTIWSPKLQFSFSGVYEILVPKEIEVDYAKETVTHLPFLADYGLYKIFLDVNDRSDSVIMANNIFISGSFLDINGLIQAGFDDYNLKIDNNDLLLVIGEGSSARLGTIAEALKYYNDNSYRNVSSSFRLARDNDVAGFGLTSHGNTLCRYNVLTGELLVDDIYVRSGGKIELYGHILNTSSTTGEIKALSGYSGVTINNNSDYNLNLQDIDISQKAEGQIKITDKAYNLGTESNPFYLETTYAYDGSKITVTDNRTFIETANGRIGTNVSVLDDGKTTEYKTLENQRYNWTSGSSTVESWYYEHVKTDSTWFWIIDYGDYETESFRLVNRDILYDNPLGRAEYITIGSPDDPIYIYEYAKKEIEEGEKKWRTTQNWTSGPFYNKKKHTRIHYDQVKGFVSANTNSIKADNPIKISFTGNAESQPLNVASHSNIILQGTLNAGSNADVTLISDKEILSLNNGGNIIAKNITLSASDGIGSVYDSYTDLSINLKDGVLDAVNSSKGDINIIAKNDKYSSNDTIVSNITNNGAGNIRLISDSSIVGLNENTLIKGRSIELMSKSGYITGANGTDLLIDTELINAVALYDINLGKKTAGDLYVLEINSLLGNVNLNVRNGSVYSQITGNVDDETKMKNLNIWRELGLFDTGKITEEQYLYMISKLPNMEQINVSGDNVSITASGSVGLSDETFSFKMSEFSSLTENQKSLVFATGNDMEISGDIITVNVKDPLKVYANTGITVEAGKDIVLYGVKDINIISAIANGDINIKGSKGIYNVSEDHTANLQGKNIIVESLNSNIGLADKALCIEASGIVTAKAKENIDIHFHNENNVINTITAGDKITLSTEGNIVSNDNTINNIIGHNINITADNIGEQDNNINFMLVDNKDSSESKLINLSANDSLYISSLGENNNIVAGVVKAENNAIISSENSDIITFDEDSYISANNIEFNAKEGNIGSEENKLKATDFELVSGYAKENIDIEIITPDALNIYEDTIRHPKLVSGSAVYNVGNLKSNEGYIDLYSSDSGINLKGEVDAKESINADIHGSITDEFGDNTSGFFSKNVNLKSKTGKIGSKDNSIRIGESASSVIPGGSNRESTLNAESEAGIYVESKDTIVASKIETEKSDVHLESENNIKAKEQENGTSNIIAENIELTAGGNIGEEGNRVVTETTKDKGKTNLNANGNIYLKQNGMNRFYSDYVINKGNGATNLLLPDNHAFIIDLDIANPGLFRIDFAERKYKNNVNIGYNSIEKLVIHPVAVRQNNEEEEVEDKYELLKDIKENIIVHPDLFSPLKQFSVPLKPISKLND